MLIKNSEWYSTSYLSSLAGQKIFSKKNTACHDIFKFVWKKCPGEGCSKLRTEATNYL